MMTTPESEIGGLRDDSQGTTRGKPSAHRVAVVAAGFAVACFAVQAFYVLIVVPSFEGPLHDLFDDRPLPPFTAFALHAGPLLLGYAFITSIAAWFALHRRRSMRRLWTFAGVAILPIILTTIAVVLPLMALLERLTPPR